MHTCMLHLTYMPYMHVTYYIHAIHAWYLLHTCIVHITLIWKISSTSSTTTREHQRRGPEGSQNYRYEDAQPRRRNSRAGRAVKEGKTTHAVQALPKPTEVRKRLTQNKNNSGAGRRTRSEALWSRWQDCLLLTIISVWT